MKMYEEKLREAYKANEETFEQEKLYRFHEGRSRRADRANMEARAE